MVVYEGGIGTDGRAVVLVYGVLFADWNNGQSEQKPFEGVCYPSGEVVIAC